MNKLVFIENNRPVTDSLTVAETFGKSHDNVMRDIRNQIDKLFEAGESQFSLLNFEESNYTNDRGREYPRFLLTEDAFAMVTMSYTTVEAMRFKVKFLKEFNDMKMELLNRQFSLPQTYSEALRALADSHEEKQEMQAKIEADKPLVLFAESLQISDDSILIGELAKVLKQNGIDIGQNRLFQTLRQEGYLIKSGEQYNMPTQRSMELKLFEIKTGSRNGSDGTIKITRTPKVTGKGQVYFVNKFKRQIQAG